MAPATSARPPGRPRARISTGGQSFSSRQVTSAPSCRSASIRWPIGRCRILAVPSSRKSPCPSVAMAVKNRTVVPLLPTNRSAPFLGIRPPQPSTRIVARSVSWSTTSPSWRKASPINRVSSLSSAPASVDVPSASAAQTSARFVMLFEPGGRIEAYSAPVGRMAIVSVMGPCCVGQKRFSADRKRSSTDANRRGSRRRRRTPQAKRAPTH